MVGIPYGTQIDKVGNKKTLKPNAKYTTPEKDILMRQMNLVVLIVSRQTYN